MPKLIYLLCLVLSLVIPFKAQASDNAPVTRRSAVVIAVEKASPAVVNISYTQAPQDPYAPFSGNRREEAIERFFNDFFDPWHTQRQPQTTLGSGVIIDGEKGYILTNAHVIEKTGRITVRLQDNREFEAMLTGSDRSSDLAVLKIDAKTPLPAIPMGKSDDLMIGETVIAIGNPFGFSHTVSTGVVSALNRSIRSGDEVFRNFIQIDAAINPGNSGGPLLNILGELIGINTAIYKKAQGIGFSIPIDTAKRVVADLIEYGEVVETWTGLTLQEVKGSLAEYYGISGGTGVVVTAIESESPSEKAGITPGDILLSINETPIASLMDYQSIKRRLPSSGKVSVTLLKGSKKKNITLETIPYPMERGESLAEAMFGIRVLKSERDRGVEISEIARQSELYQVGVRPGDRIRKINDRVISTKESFLKTLIAFRHQKNLVFLVVRGGRGYYINVASARRN